MPSRFIGPGDVYCSRIPHLVTTILGSCVAVCLFDPAVGIGGMNHFVLPFHPSGEAPSTRHGDYATATLIRRLGNLGADPERLRAKVFGGSVMLMGGKNGVPSPLSVGARNVALTRGLLAERGIPIERERVLETSGLMIKMLTSTGDVWVRKVGTASFAHVVPRVEATS
ncbi:chemotaxis protein CheD [Pararhodospirillum photometricum]|uniref:chemotaxis protein CheD n=1 Tax=Pararhodospirillum photometricum TaxID=1084 RepID=UPI0012FF252C|nr:chemotaxis protein CheD [Pararhodospirillum photometricum]